MKIFNRIFNTIGKHPIITTLFIFASAYYMAEYNLTKYNAIVLTWGALLVISIISILTFRKRTYKRNNEESLEYEEYKPLSDNDLRKIDEVTKDSYDNSYERKYLLTINEKEQFKKILQWAKRRNLLVFTKVRLLDLITPRKDSANYKVAFWKIQAKHVDFLICDQNIKVKCIIEICDKSHNRPDRIERDKFVTEILQACGYKILQTYNITENQLDEICEFNNIETENPA